LISRQARRPRKPGGGDFQMQRRSTVNREMIEGRWRLFLGRLKEEWGQFKHDELAVISARREQEAGRLLLRYGLARADALQQLRFCQQLARQGAMPATARQRLRAAQSTAWQRTY